MAFKFHQISVKSLTKTLGGVSLFVTTLELGRIQSEGLVDYHLRREEGRRRSSEAAMARRVGIREDMRFGQNEIGVGERLHVKEFGVGCI